MSEFNLSKDQEKERELFEIIVFFDLFNFPLTFYEIKKYLEVKEKVNDLYQLLENLITRHKIEVKNGFYFLKNREEIVGIRRNRYNYSLRKIKIAKKFARIFALLPFIQTIYLVNSIGAYNLRDNSDIDFFIITKKERIWLSRFFTAGLAKILHKRPNKKTKRDKICLSFYLAEDNLDLSKLKLSDSDPYFDYWERNLYLLVNKKNGAHERLIRENNLEHFYNNIDLKESRKKSVSPGILASFFKHLEGLAKSLQLRIMPHELQVAASLAREDGGVIIKDDIIKLYLKDRRLEIRKKYEQKIR